jgi:hypothetical protein
MSYDLKAICKQAFPSYRGRKIREDRSGRVSFYDLNWSGGTRNTYRAVRLNDGASSGFDGSSPPPWANPMEGASVTIPAGYVIVEETIFCGKGPWMRIYWPADPPALTAASLPESVTP